MIQEAILQTLKYFDVQDLPLTASGIFNYLLKMPGVYKVSFGEVMSALDGMHGQVESFNGFYFLSGRKEIAEKRWLNNYYSTPRLRKAIKYAKYFRHIPFVAGVALSGSEALNNSKERSDIDLLVLTEKNRIWLARVFVTGFFHVLGVRRHGQRIKNRFCLNHYIEKDKKILGDRNLYTAIEYVSLIPLYGGKEIYRFQERNLDWIKEFLTQPTITLYKTAEPSGFKKSIESRLSGRVGNFAEKILGKLQMKKIKLQDYITVEKDELSFHPGSKGQKVLKRAGF